MRPAHSLCLIALLVLALLPGAAAQSLETPAVDPQSLDATAFDPLTGEPVPFGFEAPPTEASATARGGGDLTPIEYLPSGATKLVRFIEPLLVLYQDGGSLVLSVFPMGTAVELDRHVIEAQPADADARGETVYVALRKERGLLILNADPLEGQLETIGTAPGRDLLAVVTDPTADYAYAGMGLEGIAVYDVSDPTSPTEVAAFDTPGSANGVDVRDSYLYVATGTDGLRIYDVSDPVSPTEVSAVGTGEQFATFVYVRNDIAWLTGGFGLLALDVSDPANPIQIGSFSTGDETTYEIDFSGDIAVLAGLDGLRALDVSDPTDIIETDFFPGSQVLSGGVIASATTKEAVDIAYGERFHGLYVQDAGDEITFVENGGFAHKMAFDGDLLYVTDLAGGLRILDTSGEETVELSRVDVPPNTQYVKVVGDYAYVADADFGGTGLTIVDVSTPTAPVTVGGFFSANQAFGLDVVADGDVVTVYLANGFSGLVVLDASDPANVTELGGFPIGANVVDVSVRDDVAYVVSFGGGMLTLDVTDPANITQLDAEPTFGFLNAIDLDPDIDSYAYVADGQNGLRVVDISDPADIVSVSTTPTLSQARDVSSTLGFEEDSFGPVVYVADDFFGIREYEFSFEETASFESGDRGIGVATQVSEGPNLVALAAGEAGVYLFEVPFIVANEDGTAAEAFALQSAFPNPFRDATTVRFTLPEASDVTLTVYDVLGRRVATLEDGPLAAGDHEATFDADGLPSGVYLIRLDAGSRHATQHVMHIR